MAEWICQIPVFGEWAQCLGLCGLPLGPDMICPKHGDVTRDARATIPQDKVAAVMAQVMAERARQDRKWGEQNHPNGTGPREVIPFGWNGGESLHYEVAEHAAEWGKVYTEVARERNGLTWRHILLEEVLETFTAPDTDALRAELIQVMATALAWIECIDRRAPVKLGE